MGSVIIIVVSLFIIYFFGIDIYRKIGSYPRLTLKRWLAYTTACTILTALFLGTTAVLLP